MKTVEPAFVVHAQHCYFLLATQVQNIVYHVDRIRDGKSFATRFVRAMQGAPSHVCTRPVLRARQVGGPCSCAPCPSRRRKSRS